MSEIGLKLKTSLKDIQLVLRGSRCFVSGVVVVRSQKNGRKIYIILFNVKEMKPQNKKKIQNFIYNCLQENIKKEIESMA